METKPNPILRLLRSSKFLTALLGVLQTLVLHYLEVPAEVWASIDALLLAVIAGIAIEDNAQKRADGLVQAAMVEGQPRRLPSYASGPGDPTPRPEDVVVSGGQADQADQAGTRRRSGL